MTDSCHLTACLAIVLFGFAAGRPRVCKIRPTQATTANQGDMKNKAQKRPKSHTAARFLQPLFLASLSVWPYSWIRRFKDLIGFGVEADPTKRRDDAPVHGDVVRSGKWALSLKSETAPRSRAPQLGTSTAKVFIVPVGRITDLAQLRR